MMNQNLLDTVSLNTSFYYDSEYEFSVECCLWVNRFCVNLCLIRIKRAYFIDQWEVFSQLIVMWGERSATKTNNRIFIRFYPLGDESLQHHFQWVKNAYQSITSRE